MCTSIAKGGQRCAAHTRPALDRATFGTPVWERVAADHASTPTGRTELVTEAADPATPADRVAALAVAIRKGDSIREANAEAAREIEQRRAARSTSQPQQRPPAPEQMDFTRRGRSMVLTDDQGRVFSLDGEKPLTFSVPAGQKPSEELMSEWKGIAAKSTRVERWLTPTASRSA